eukprot:m.46912 g.46912  ORF g.46912 m.46912 type:complete len:891 (+) comp12288_c0_seq1:190-2862(+)
MSTVTNKGLRIIRRSTKRSIKSIKQIGPYALGQKLGEGSYGAVHIATHLPTGQQVALKFIDKRQIEEEYVIRNLQREVTIMRQLDHPYIIKLFQVLEFDDFMCIVTEKAEKDFLTVLLDTGIIAEPLAKRYIAELCLAVEHLHQQKIAHRDLKVENMMLDKIGRVKLIDFGLSNQLADGQEMFTTCCGSLAYSAPELLGKKPYSFSVDVWGIAICMFVMMTARLPFQADSLTQLHANILDKNYTLPDFFSEELKDLLSRCFEFRPSKRPTLQEVMSHPWISEEVASARTKAEKFSEIDENVISRMVNMGFDEDPQRIRDAMILDKWTPTFVTYHLLRQAKEFREDTPKLRSRLSLDESPSPHPPITPSHARHRSLARNAASLPKRSTLRVADAEHIFSKNSIHDSSDNGDGDGSIISRRRRSSSMFNLTSDGRVQEDKSQQHQGLTGTDFSLPHISDSKSPTLKRGEWRHRTPVQIHVAHADEDGDGDESHSNHVSLSPQHQSAPSHRYHSISPHHFHPTPPHPSELPHQSPSPSPQHQDMVRLLPDSSRLAATHRPSAATLPFRRSRSLLNTAIPDISLRHHRRLASQSRKEADTEGEQRHEALLQPWGVRMNEDDSHTIPSTIQEGNETESPATSSTAPVSPEHSGRFNRQLRVLYNFLLTNDDNDFLDQLNAHMFKTLRLAVDDSLAQALQSLRWDPATGFDSSVDISSLTAVVTTVISDTNRLTPPKGMIRPPEQDQSKHFHRKGWSQTLRVKTNRVRSMSRSKSGSDIATAALAGPPSPFLATSPAKEVALPIIKHNPGRSTSQPRYLPVQVLEANMVNTTTVDASSTTPPPLLNNLSPNSRHPSMLSSAAPHSVSPSFASPSVSPVPPVSPTNVRRQRSQSPRF